MNDEQKVCPRCTRRLAASAESWLEAPSPALCGVVGNVFHGRALASCEKSELGYLRREVAALRRSIQEAGQAPRALLARAWDEGHTAGEADSDEILETRNPYRDEH